jgi:hypothetical protein
VATVAANIDHGSSLGTVSGTKSARPASVARAAAPSAPLRCRGRTIAVVAPTNRPRLAVSDEK